MRLEFNAGPVDSEGKRLYSATDGGSISGNLHIELKQSKPVSHVGLVILLVGEIELPFDRATYPPFSEQRLQILNDGEFKANQVIPFEFANAEKPHESYYGSNMVLRYYVKAILSRNFASDIVAKEEFLVRKAQVPAQPNHTITMEVGIEDCLHIEFEYNQSNFHLQDVVVGRIYFLLVRIKIKHMELVVVKRESVSTSGPSGTYNDSKNLSTYELMDGAAVRGESIPVRLFLSPLPLTPTYTNVEGKFSVRYYLNLVLVDEDDRRYFKQQEITLWRRAEDVPSEKTSEPTSPQQTQL
jgi:vacuolar protein sorting-associated protein 26